MVRVVVLLGVRKTLSLCRQGMDDHRAVVNPLRFFERSHQRGNIVPVDVAYVLKTKLVDQRTWKHGRSDGVFHGFCRAAEAFPEAWDTFEGVADLFFEVLIALRLPDPVEVSAQGADRR